MRTPTSATGRGGGTGILSVCPYPGGTGIPPVYRGLYNRYGRAARRAARGAFTLLELIVVLGVIVVLTGVIVPRMGRSVGHRELGEAAARFTHTARAARELAVAQARVCAIEIDLDRGGYGVVMQSGGRGDRSADSSAEASPSPGSSGGRTERWQPMQASWLKAQRWPATVSVDSFRTSEGKAATSGTQYVEFFPDGTSSGGAIRLAGGDDAYLIVVHPHSGRVVHGDPRTTTFGLDRYDLGD